MDLTINLKFFSIKRTISISRQWIQYGIVAAAILLTTIIAYWGSPNIYVLVLVLLAAVLGLFALLWQPNLGFILVFLGGAFMPTVGPSGMNVAILMIAFMMGLWILNMLVVQKKVTLIRTSAIAPIMIFLIVAVIAFFIGQVPWFVFARQAPITAQVGGFAVFVFSVSGMLLAAHLIKDIRWLKILTWTFLGLAALYLIGRVAGLSFITGLYHNGFIAQSMFWTWVVALAAGQLIFNTKLNRRDWWLLAALIALTLYVAGVRGFDWKSGWVPPVVAIAILLSIRYRHLIVFAIPFVVMAVLYVIVDLIASDDYSWGTRVEAWRIVLEISRASPLFGMGFANYYWYTPLFPIRGWRVSFNSHSQFVDLVAQTGYLGFLSFLWLFFALGRLTWSVANKLPPGFARGYSYGVFGGIVATMVAAFLGDWVLPFVYNVGLAGFRSSILPWIFIGGVISLEYMLLSSTPISEDKLV
jgi:O-antigen ligase